MNEKEDILTLNAELDGVYEIISNLGLEIKYSSNLNKDDMVFVLKKISIILKKIEDVNDYFKEFLMRFR